MVWSDFFSTIQLAAGLNTAYFSLTELRQPVLAAELRALERLKLVIDNRKAGEATSADFKKQHAEFLQLVVNFDTLYLRYNKMDVYLGRVCLIMAVLYILLLIAASFLASYKINIVAAASISVFGFLPVSLCLLANVVAMQQVRLKVSRRRWILEPLVLSNSQASYDGSGSTQ